MREGYAYGEAGFWSLDLSQRVVREKMGSGLVLISMILQLKGSLVAKDPTRRKREKVGSYVVLGKNSHCFSTTLTRLICFS